jgi:hypothetical protein
VIEETEVPAELDEAKFLEVLSRHADIIEEKVEQAEIASIEDVIVA